MTTAPIVLAPLLPWPVLAVLAAFGAAAVAFALWRRASGALIRLAAFLGFLAVLTGPTLIRATTRPLPDIAVVLLDRSASMTLGDRARLAEAAVASLRRDAAGLPGLDLRVVAVPPAPGGGTDLAAAAADALAGIPPDQRAGLIAVTDGEVTPPAPGSGVPLSVLIAARGEETDRELRLLAAPAYGLVGQTIPLRFEVLDHGPVGSRAPVPVTVSADGAPVWRGMAVPGVPVGVPVPVVHPGNSVVAVTAAPLAGAVTPLNDSAAFTLEGIRRKLAVLLISGSPDQGVRTWRLLLKSDPAIELVHFTILRTPTEAIDAPARDMALIPFPVDQLFEQDLGHFDLIILDRFSTLSLLPDADLARIAASVRAGGALLAEFGPEFAGPESLANTALAPVLPALPVRQGGGLGGPDPAATITGAFSPALTALGVRDPVTAPFAGAALAPWYRFEATDPNAGNVLLAAPGGFPLLVLAQEGKGRVAELTSDQFWLWTRAEPDAGPAAPLLRRVVHWLLREPALEAEALSATAANGTLAIQRQTLSTAAPPALVTAPDATTTTVTLTQAAPGRFAGAAAAARPGVYRIDEGGLVTFAAVSPENTAEFRDLAATATHFPPEASVVWLGRNGPPPLASLIARRHARALTGTTALPLLPPLPALILLLALVLGAWLREARR